MQELAPGIMVFNNVFTNAIEYISAIEESAMLWQAAKVLEDQEKSNTIKNYEARDTDLIILPGINEEGVDSDILFKMSNEFYKNILPCVEEYKKHYFAQAEKFEKPQLLRYGNGQHFHEHIDDHPLFTRRISMTFYINDNYDGGDIEFPRFNLKIKAKSNQLLMFPSSFVYAHKVSKVTSGTRYVVVQWIA